MLLPSIMEDVYREVAAYDLNMRYTRPGTFIMTRPALEKGYWLYEFYFYDGCEVGHIGGTHGIIELEESTSGD